MQPTLFVPPLTGAQSRRLRQGLRAPDAFTVRRCQILLASAGGTPPSAIARQLGCTAPTVRNAIHAFAREGRLLGIAAEGDGPPRHPSAVSGNPVKRKGPLTTAVSGPVGMGA